MQWCPEIISSRGRRRRRRPLAAAVVLAAMAAACGSPAEGPQVAALERPAPVETAVDQGSLQAGPAAVAGEPATTAAPTSVDGIDICDLARDPEAMADVERWAAYIPALEAALPAEVDVAAALGDLRPDTPATPTVAARLDQVWDLVDERCQQDPRVEQCRNLIAVALADPVGWAVRATDAAEVEAAFALAVANWTDLRQRVAGDELRGAIDAHLSFLSAASRELAAVGWGPGRVDVLEPLADQLVGLGDAEVVDPLYELEADCGFP